MIVFASAHPLTVVIDGPSGSGKTTLAAQLERDWPAQRTVQVLHMDDIYPGWQGLETASAIIENLVIAARVAGRDVSLPSWNWELSQPGEMIRISSDRDLIIEGCGSLRRTVAKVVSHTFWVEEPDDIRKARALARGNEDFEAHWDEWDAQFREFESREDPRAHASVIVGSKR